MAYYLGVDGGGTKTEFLLVDEEGRALGGKVVQGSNPNDIGVEGTYEVVINGVKSLCEGCNVPMTETCVYVGGSGCGVGDISKSLQSRMNKEVKACAFSSDLPNVVEMGLAEEDGIVVIAGTGSVFALQREGTLRVVGGNGFLFEEYGSGFALGRAGFIAAFAQIDGLQEETALLPLIEERLGGGLKSRLNDIYRGGKRYIAEFAPLVLQAAEEGDRIAREIVEKNAEFISTTLNRLAQNFNGRVRVALAGGTFKHEGFLQRVKGGLDEKVVALRLAAPPVFGAVRLAAKIGNKDVYGTFTDTLTKGALNDKIRKGGVI